MGIIRTIASRTGLVKSNEEKEKDKVKREEREKIEKDEKDAKAKNEREKLPKKYFKNLYDSYIAYRTNKSQDSKNNISKNILLLLYYSKLQKQDITIFPVPGTKFKDEFIKFIKNLKLFDDYKHLIDIHFEYIIDDKTEKQLDNNIVRTETTDKENLYTNTYIEELNPELQKYKEYVIKETDGRWKYLYNSKEYKDRQNVKKEGYDGYIDTDEPYENYNTIIGKQSIISKGLKEIALLIELNDNISIFKTYKLKLSNDSKKFADIKIVADEKNNYIITDFILYLDFILTKLGEYYKKFEKKFNEDLVALSKLYEALNAKINYNVEKPKELITFWEKFEIPKNEIYKSYLESLKNVDVLKDEDIEVKYAKAQAYINKLNKLKVEELKDKPEKEKKEIKLKLASFDKLLNTNNGSWKTDKDKKLSYSDELIKLQNDYIKILENLDYTQVEISKDYEELYELYEKIKSISSKINGKERITQDELAFIEDFQLTIDKYGNDKLFNSDENYKNGVQKSLDLYNKLKREGSFSDSKIKEIKEADKIIDPNVVYFDNYASIFSFMLYYIVLACIVVLFSIVLITIISFFSLIYEILKYLILIFINPQTIKGFSIDYLSKNIINCTKTNLSDDIFYIITSQKQNLVLFNLSAYVVYLLLFYVLLFVILTLYSRFMNKEFKGSLKDIDKANVFLPLVGVIFLFSAINFFLYSKLFKDYVYIPYKFSENKEKAVDEKIADYILIKDEEDNSLIDDNFFKTIYDLTLIDELNKIFSNGIESKNKDNCLEQKLLIYDIYMYLREYVSFDSEMKDKFKEYCTTTVDEKPTYKDTKNKITFVSLLNNSEVKMIRKYHEELAFFNKIADDKLEFYNGLNISINNKIKNINTEIITHNKTMIPFFVTVVYILVIFALSLLAFYLVIKFILEANSKNTNPFNSYFISAADMINDYFYKKIYSFYEYFLLQKVNYL